MDQDTRNKLQRATQQVRRILEEEFAEQLEGTFDVLPDGKILPEPGKHLDARQRLTRQKLVDAIEHIKASGKTPEEAVDEYTREAAFTFLNRFVALRMLEARGMLQECVSKGDASSGFKEFCGLAPGLSSLDDGGYRLYLECLFDELTVEVKVLFDRRDPASLLWPRRSALKQLLDTLAQADLACVWSEDETIGWVYQYFNSGEERKKMREESQAPRNSRELAVRNQFFTPRYVVEFLTDNTLGRIWYEMRKGQTRLVDECRYLVRRPGEVFLNEGQEPPEDESDDDQHLSQEQILKKTVYIPHRPIQDPRELKILDPACGSGHFLLYAFDLLISIYEEAWHDETSAPSEVTENRLRDDYPDLKRLHAALPALVLAHNLHGIDIDPRAAQIAALALWMRGQRAFNDFKLIRQERPAIARSNIVCAEPMPGEAAFLDEFISGYLSDDAEGRFLATLVRKVFEAMKLAGEAGSLLKIEQDIADEVAKAKKQWLTRPEFKQQALFDAGPKSVQQELDLTRGITDESFWEDAEQRIYDALRDFSEQAERSGGFQRHLFAADTARGFAFIDLCRQRYDVALMNPPFGECSSGIEQAMRDEYGSLANDIYVLFVSASLDRLNHTGSLGAISSRGFTAGRDQRDFRPIILNPSHSGCLVQFVDLGHDILDDALVETCCYTISRYKSGENGDIAFRDLRTIPRDRLNDFREAIDSVDVIIQNAKKFLAIPQAALLYTATDAELEDLGAATSLDPDFGRVTKGLNTGNDERFLRLTWEVPFSSLNARWRFCAKGGDYRWFLSNIITVVDWMLDGLHLVEYMGTKSDNTAQARRSSSHYFKPGTTYTYRSGIFSLRALPAGCIFTNGGPVLIPKDATRASELLAAFATKRYEGLLRQVEKSSKYETGRMGKLPVPSITEESRFSEEWPSLVDYLMRYESRVETSPYFCGLGGISDFNDVPTAEEIEDRIRTTVALVDGSPSDEFVQLAATSFADRFGFPNGPHHLVSYAVGLAFGRYGQSDPQPTPSCFAPLIDQFHAVKSQNRHSRFPDGIAAHSGREIRESELATAIVDSLASLEDSDDEIRTWLIEAFGDHGLCKYLSATSGFFDVHIKEHSGAFRRAPIYWQLATTSASYSVWLYYHCLTRDTCFQVLNEYVKPRLDHERQKVERLRSEAGAEPTRSQRKEIEDQEKFVTELAAMAEEVERIAPLWNPNLNDGVIINFAPLWRLVPQNRSWQKECKKCWDKLVKGEYDWAHLAMHLWPERVVPKCVTDASLAIAHGLEEVFWEQDDRDRFQPKEEPQGGWEPVIKKLVSERTSPAVKAALESLLAAPAPAGSSKSRRRKATT